MPLPTAAIAGKAARREVDIGDAVFHLADRAEVLVP
jgi:hypothetical protein